MRPRERRAILPSAIAALLGVLLLPTSALAAATTFLRFEEEGTANWIIVEECGDGTTSTTRITVIGGMEFESPDLDDVNEFVTVRIRNLRTCEGQLVNEFGTGPATYTSSPSLQQATVSGTVTLTSGAVATIDVSWEGTGSIETTVNTTQFPGFSGVFIGQVREAVATGSLVVNGEDLLEGATLVSARIETLEDRNITTGL